MTPKQLKVAGEALYGPLWQDAMADAFGYTAKVVSKWATGTHSVPVPVQGKLMRLLEKKQLAISMVLDEIGQ
jgi:hypothetical protein